MYDALVKKYEGCILTAYPDPATGGEPWTIGWGSTTYLDGTKVKKGDKITQEHADKLLSEYINKNIIPVINKIPYILTSNQKEALVSLLYNIDATKFMNTKCFSAICNKDVEGMFKEWDWIKASGKVMKGLVKRRSHERFLFFKDL